MSLFNLVIGNGLMIHVSMMGVFKRRRYTLVLWAVLNPPYWILHSIPRTRPSGSSSRSLTLPGLADVGARPAPSPAG